jgi:hypothetical protein
MNYADPHDRTTIVQRVLEEFKEGLKKRALKQKPEVK